MSHFRGFPSLPVPYTDQEVRGNLFLKNCHRSNFHVWKIPPFIPALVATQNLSFTVTLSPGTVITGTNIESDSLQWDTDTEPKYCQGPNILPLYSKHQKNRKWSITQPSSLL